jgi:DNA-binding LacI/PurR family transcriptional regulator
VVIAPQDAAAAAVRDLEATVPVVAVEVAEGEAPPSVSVDQETGARLATEHLLSLGHASVHHVTGPLDWLEARARAAGWRAALADAGAAAPEPEVGDWSATSGHRAGRRLLARAAAGEAVTAVFAGNDQMAVGLLRALAEEGVPVPGRVSVVGFDDVPEAAYYSPPLTTVRQDFAELGRRCLQALLARLAGEPVDVRPVVPSFVVRASTAPPVGERGGDGA